MGLYADTNQVGKIISSPFVMRLPTRPSGREPDLIFIRTEHFKWLRETHLDGPANLVVEIVSPESDARDRGDKFVEYESAGIPEYWLIDPLRQQAVFYELTDGRYRPGTINEHGIYHSQALPGFWLRIEWLWIAAQATARRADYTQAMQEALRLALGHNRLRELLEE
jgi:Uma2 family endonuclease